VLALEPPDTLGSRKDWSDMSIAVRSLLFTVVVPAAATVYIPWWVLNRGGPLPLPTGWHAVSLIAIGAALYLSCLWVFAIVGRGTPAPWDAPRRFVAVGPYEWVRNPMYIAVLLVVLGEAWLFLSTSLLLYAAALATAFHVFVIAYEEPTLRRSFEDTYARYVSTVPRWIPRPPRVSAT